MPSAASPKDCFSAAGLIVIFQTPLEPRHAVAAISENGFEPRAIELIGRTLEKRIASNALRNCGVGHLHTHLESELVERFFLERVRKHPARDTDSRCPFRRERAAELARQLLETLDVGSSELLDGDGSAADLGDSRVIALPEGIAVTGACDGADNGAPGDNRAEPTNRAFSPAKHAVQRVVCGTS